MKLMLVALLFSTPAFAVSPLNLHDVIVNTDDAWRHGTNCYSTNFDINAADGSGGTIHCATWTTQSPRPPVDVGPILDQVNLDGITQYYGCRFLDIHFSAFTTLEIDCRGLFGNGFDVP